MEPTGMARAHNEIIIVDDSSLDAELLENALRLAGIGNPIRHIPSCVRAMAHLRSPENTNVSGPRVIFIDLKLPCMDGYEFLTWIKSDPSFKDFLLVGTSGYRETGYIRRAYELGASSFIPKPCGTGDLKTLVSTFPQFWNVTPADVSDAV